jgi:uncharacterized protein (DUF2236 family)
MSISTGDETVPDVVREAVANPLAMGAAAANVIMQLSLLPVGHGVAKSTVDTGRADQHPIKRLRTTVGFLVVAMLGTTAERLHARQEINRSHGPVHSSPEDPVPYNAFDPELQLWVAACLYRGFEMAYTMMHPRPAQDDMDILYRHCGRLATTLQVGPDRWPADRSAYEEYWASMLPLMSMDDLTRGYLLELANLGALPAPVRQLLGPLHRWVTAGFLPAEFRHELGLPWSATSQRAFDALFHLQGLAMRATPRPVRLLPWNLYLWDFRRRMRTGRPFV